MDQARASVAPEAVAERKKQVYPGLLPGVRLNEPLLQLLRSCRGWMRTALVTTASRSNVDALLQVHGLVSLFDSVVTGDDVAQHKPHPAAYELALQKLALSPEVCVAFEDSDIGEASARAAGVKVIRVSLSAA
jgi:HAD superfamily hydrolase (TIGR01509 family)